MSFVLEDEIFYEQKGKSEWDKNRITTGIEWVLNDQVELICFYRFENELGKVLADFDHTLGIYLGFSLEKKKEDERRRSGHPYPW